MEALEVAIGFIIGVGSNIIVLYLNKKYNIYENAKKKIKGPYAHLSGSWYRYNISEDPSVGSEPFWTTCKEELEIKKSFFKKEHKVQGKSVNIDHPMTKLSHNIEGKIEVGGEGRMTLMYDCIQDPTDRAIIVYPNLLSENLLVGQWLGFDFGKKPLSAPIILSRKELTVEELNNYVVTQNLQFVSSASLKANEFKT